MPRRRKRVLLISGLSVMALILSGSPAGAAPGKAHPRGVDNLARTAHQKVASNASTLAAEGDDDQEGSSEIAEQAAQWNEARSSPGIVAPGAYSAAWADLQRLPRTGGSWVDETALPYNSDDPRYRDIDSNSSRRRRAGHRAGHRPGRGQRRLRVRRVGRRRRLALATGGGHWQPISDKLPVAVHRRPAAGRQGPALVRDRRGQHQRRRLRRHRASTCWATRGTGSSSRATGSAAPSWRARRSSTCASCGNTVWAATSRGVWTHSATNLNGAVEAGVRAEPGLPARRGAGDRPERAVQEHRQRHRGRPEGPLEGDPGDRLAQRGRLQRLLRQARAAPG